MSGATPHILHMGGPGLSGDVVGAQCLAPHEQQSWDSNPGFLIPEAAPSLWARLPVLRWER